MTDTYGHRVDWDRIADSVQMACQIRGCSLMAWGMPGSQVHDEGFCHTVATTCCERARAVRQVCALARDAADATTILEQLGLSAGEAKEQR